MSILRKKMYFKLLFVTAVFIQSSFILFDSVFQSDIDLRSYSYPNVSEILGSGNSRYLSTSMDIGDFDGDGIDDIAVSAQGNPIFNLYGYVYIIFGSQTILPDTIDIINTDQTMLIINGYHPKEGFGKSITVLNIDNDEYDDLVITTLPSNRISPDKRYIVRTYVVYGSPELKNLDTLDVSTHSSHFTIIKEDYSNNYDLDNVIRGFRSASGDVNNDGFDDMSGLQALIFLVL